MTMNIEQEFAMAVKSFEDWEQSPVGLMFLRIEAISNKSQYEEFGLTDDEAYQEAYESVKDRINTYIQLSKF